MKQRIFCFTTSKGTFVDEANGDGAELDAEANEWASNLLVPQRAWEQFVCHVTMQ